MKLTIQYSDFFGNVKVEKTLEDVPTGITLVELLFQRRDELTELKLPAPLREETSVDAPGYFGITGTHYQDGDVIKIRDAGHAWG